MELPFHLLILKVFHAQKKNIRPYMASLGLFPGQPKILAFLAKHDCCMQKELADFCDIEPATVSRILHAMEQSQLIERAVAENNRRASRIRLTAKGREAHRRVETYCGDVTERALQHFSAAEKQQFRDYLQRMYENLSRA